MLFIQYLISSVVCISGLLFGYFAAIIAPEELFPGRQYIKAFKAASILSALALFSFFILAFSQKAFSASLTIAFIAAFMATAFIISKKEKKRIKKNKLVKPGKTDAFDKAYLLIAPIILYIAYCAVNTKSSMTSAAAYYSALASLIFISMFAVSSNASVQHAAAKSQKLVRKKELKRKLLFFIIISSTSVACAIIWHFIVEMIMRTAIISS